MICCSMHSMEHIVANWYRCVKYVREDVRYALRWLMMDALLNDKQNQHNPSPNLYA